jgi:hypothetical protein
VRGRGKGRGKFSQKIEKQLLFQQNGTVHVERKKTVCYTYTNNDRFTYIQIHICNTVIGACKVHDVHVKKVFFMCKKRVY